MDKDTKIFSLYNQLGKSGQRRDAQKFIAKKCGVRVVSVKCNYLHNREFPIDLDESIKDTIIEYLEKQIEADKLNEVA